MGSIRWGDHSTDFTRLIAELYENVEFTDCELDTDGGLVKAHRVILAACSPYFKNLLVDHNEMIIPLKEIKCSDMKHLLDFMYFGEVDVPVVDVPSFMITAQFFQVASFIRFDSNFTENSCCNDTCETRLSNSSTVSGVNFMNNKECFNEHGTVGVSVQVDGISANTVLQTVSVAVPEHLSEVRNSHEYEARNFKPTMVKMAVQDEDRENFSDHLNPISFVAVSPFSEKIEEHNDMSSDAELKNPLEDDCDLSRTRLVKRQSSWKIVPRMKRSCEEKMNTSVLTFPNPEDISISNAQKSNSGSVVFSVCDIKILFDELSAKKEGNSILATALTSGTKTNQNVTLDEMVNTGHFKDCFVERSADLEVKFETICDISEHEIKEEKLCEYMIPQNVVDLNNAPLTQTEQKEELVPDDSTDLDIHEEIASPVTSKINLMEAKLTNPSEVECGNENSALPKNRDSSRIRSIPSKEKVTLKKKSFNSSQCDGAFSSETKDKLLPSHKVHLCSSKLASENGLRQRVPTPCAGLKNISCSICEVSFTQKGSLKRHMRRIHTDQKKFPCSICQEAFNRRCLLQVHMLTHAGERPFLCEFCGASFDRENKMKKHVRYHFGWRPYPCEICKKAFRMKSHLNEHMQIHTGEKPFSCEICKVSYARKYVLKQHMRIHTGDRRFKCGICNASFERRETLRKHFQRHTGEKLYSCGICKESFACGENLKAHMPIHRDRKRFSCDTCKMSFPRKVNFKKHMRTHSVVKPYSCGICKLCFLRNYELTKHMRTHTGEKPFSCEICEMSFAHRGHLTRHILTHSGERPFSCEICDTSFARKDRLKTHMRTHTAEKQSLCVICKGTFNGKTHLNEHLRTHTTEKLFSY